MEGEGNSSFAKSNLSSFVATLAKELSILKKLIYRNHNQHGATKIFRYLKKLANDVQNILTCGLESLCSSCRKHLSINIRSSSDDINEAIFLAIRIRNATKFTLQVIGTAMKAGSVVTDQLAVGLFGPLFSTLVALSASVFTALANCAISMDLLAVSLSDSILMLATGPKLKPGQVNSLRACQLTAEECQTISKLRAVLAGAAYQTPEETTMASTTSSGAAATIDQDTNYSHHQVQEQTHIAPHDLSKTPGSCSEQLTVAVGVGYEDMGEIIASTSCKPVLLQDTTVRKRKY